MTSATQRHSSRHLRGATRLALAFAGVLGLTIVATQLAPAPAAHAAPGLRYRWGYSVQGSWLCYGWSNGAYHCTQRWHRSGGALVSDSPAWVPNAWRQGAGGRPAARTVSNGGGGGGGSWAAAPRNIGPWVPPPGRYAYAMRDFRGDPYSGFFGVCTWYAWYRHQNEPLMQLGMASQWAYNASRHGLRVSYSPVAGATAVFAPGVQGASGGGHAAHVEAVYGNGWFLVSEMSFYWNGGGWGRVSYRYAHAGPGVAFIM